MDHIRSAFLALSVALLGGCGGGEFSSKAADPSSDDGGPIGVHPDGSGGSGGETGDSGSSTGGKLGVHPPGSGGSQETGGAPPDQDAGSGGQVSTGGTPGTGGAGTGGESNDTGGTSGTGGKTSTGGDSGTGGTISTGGTVGTGGTGSGGHPNTGGTTSTGGTTGTGGAGTGGANTGGVTSTGGTTSTGGMTGSGGTAGSGGSTGGTGGDAGGDPKPGDPCIYDNLLGCFNSIEVICKTGKVQAVLGHSCNFGCTSDGWATGQSTPQCVAYNPFPARPSADSTLATALGTTNAWTWQDTDPGKHWVVAVGTPTGDPCNGFTDIRTGITYHEVSFAEMSSIFKYSGATQGSTDDGAEWVFNTLTTETIIMTSTPGKSSGTVMGMDWFLGGKPTVKDIPSGFIGSSGVFFLCVSG